MASVTVRILNNPSTFQAKMQDKNVSEVKRVLIEAVTQMRSRRWNWRCFSSACRAMKFNAEDNLLAVLKTSDSMHEITQALVNYKRRLNDFQRQIHPEGNTSAFIRGIEPLTRLPSYIPASIDIDIRNAMKKAGYQPYKRGMCYGIAWTALLACVRRGGQAYMKRMQYLEQTGPPSLPGTDDTYQVYPFFDAVTLSMTNYRNMKGYQKGIGFPGRQEVPFPGRVIGGHEPEYQVPVVKHTFIAECTPETVIKFLQQTRENNKGIPFGVMIRYPGHVTSIGFDGNKWLAVNHDSHYYTEDPLYTFLHEQSNYHRNGKMIAAMEVVSSNKHSLNINNNALVFDAKKSVSVSLGLYLSLLHGCVNTIIDCITVIGQQAQTPKALFDQLSCKYRGVPGFYMTLVFGYSDAIAAFIRKSAAVITALPLPKEKQANLLYELLACKASGRHGFYMTLLYGCSDAITAFTEGIEQLPLTTRQKQKLKHPANLHICQIM